MPQEYPKYLSVGEVAGILRVSEKTVYKMLADKQLRGAFKVNGLWGIDRDIFLADLETRARTNGVRGITKMRCSASKESGQIQGVK